MSKRYREPDRLEMTMSGPVCISLKRNLELDLQRFSHETYPSHEYTNEIIEQFKIYFLEHEWKEFTYRYPVTWLDHLKERFFPVWAKRAFPVHYRVETIRASEAFPFNRIQFPKDLGPRIRIALRSTTHLLDPSQEDE